MSPDDPRHGTTRGFHAGCRDLCCRAARARYEKASRLARLSGGRSVPAIGSQRRIRALMALGWHSTDIATACGWNDRNAVLRVLNGQKGKPTRWLERETADRICGVYERLCMTLAPATPVHARTRAIAARRGYLPPLAWDDIDNDPEPATAPFYEGEGVDEVVVMRLLEGQRVNSTRAEREAAVAQWVRDGGSEAELCSWHGWRPGRYSRPATLRLVEGDVA